MAFKEDVNSQLIITIGAMSGFMVIVVVIGLQAWFMSEEKREMDEKYADAQNPELVELRKEEHTKISTYRWIDKDRKIAAIPVDDAMTMLIQNKGKLPATQPK
jgi:hypothetical protein